MLAAARGRAARQKNVFKMEFLSIMFIWVDSILDAKMFQYSAHSPVRYLPFFPSSKSLDSHLGGLLH